MPVDKLNSGQYFIKREKGKSKMYCVKLDFLQSLKTKQYFFLSSIVIMEFPTLYYFIVIFKVIV